MKTVFPQQVHNKYLLFTLCISSLISACASNTPAPVETATVLNNSQGISQRYSENTSKSHSRISTKNNSHSHVSTFAYGSKTTANALKRYDSFDGYICEDAPMFLGKSIGDGECVDLVKLCSNAPLTRYWKPGGYVFGKDIPAGTAIATFRRGKYPNKEGYHAAIYSHQDKNGIYAWDQWHGQPVHLRYILAKQKHKKAGNNASKYRVIRR